jgi:argininosuccinate lyase
VEGVYRARLKGKLDETAASFLSSLEEDRRIFEEDIDGTEAHDIMLHEQGVLTRGDLTSILRALEHIRLQWREGKLALDARVEDVHEYIEGRVIDAIGMEIGGKMHSGRSRNDQVALDTRMRLRVEVNQVSDHLLGLIDALHDEASHRVELPVLLYTHTQHAQTGTFAHYLLAYVDRLLRDLQRLRGCYDRINRNPLGACAIGGTSIPINRQRTTSLLGFDGVVENSLDAVSSRDYALETVAALAILMAGLSRIAEDLILWSTTEYNYIELDDAFASVSSVMPQKKNPGPIELTRGRTGKVFGALIQLLTTVKGLPSGYNRDLQEAKPPLWVSLDTAKAALAVLTGIVSTLKVNDARMIQAARESYAFAVDLAERLVVEGALSFREAHSVVGRLIREMADSGEKPEQLSGEKVEKVAMATLGKKVSISEDVVRSAVDVNQRIALRNSQGSPHPSEVKKTLEVRGEQIRTARHRLRGQKSVLNRARKDLMATVQHYLST